MNKSEAVRILEQWKDKKNIKLYTPFKYFKGLDSEVDVIRRANEILKGSKQKSNNPNAYRANAFKTDRIRKTRLSKYSRDFFFKYPDLEGASLAKKSAVTKVPLAILQKVYAKGYAAWRTGHRVGATPQEWGTGRVHSFLQLGCTAMSADSRLMKQAISQMKKNNVARLLDQPIGCPLYKLRTKYYQRFKMNDFLKSLQKNKSLQVSVPTTIKKTV